MRHIKTFEQLNENEVSILKQWEEFEHAYLDSIDKYKDEYNNLKGPVQKFEFHAKILEPLKLTFPQFLKEIKQLQSDPRITLNKVGLKYFNGSK